MSKDIDVLRHDTLEEIYDLQLLGAVYLRRKDFGSAIKSFEEALNKSKGIDPAIGAKSEMYLASLMHRTDRIDSALCMIRGSIYKVDTLSRNNALSIAAGIYRDAGILDTAYVFAKELIHSKNPINKKNGYSILLSPELISYSNLDTILSYISSYRDILESMWDENEHMSAINQQSAYNYQLHVRDKKETEKVNRSLKNWIIIGIIVILCLCVVVLTIKNLNKNNRIALYEALRDVEKLKQIINEQLYNNKTNEKPNTANAADFENGDEIKEEMCEKESVSQGMTDAGIRTALLEEDCSYKENDGNDDNDIRLQLRESLFDLYNESTEVRAVSQAILMSEAYSKLKNLIMEGKELKEGDTLWEELEDVVLISSPRFKENLMLLMGGKLSSYDFNTSLLIKCGVSPTELSKLLNRSKGAIVSRRESMCVRIFGKKLGTKVVDGIIRLL